MSPCFRFCKINIPPGLAKKFAFDLPECAQTAATQSKIAGDELQIRSQVQSVGNCIRGENIQFTQEVRCEWLNEETQVHMSPNIFMTQP